MRNDYDIVVAGAGIAGSVAALLFARQGFSVLVVDQKLDEERYKALCTHFIQPLARPVLNKLSLEDEIEAAGGVPTKAAFWTSAGWIDPPGDYAREPGQGDGRLLAYNMERRLLDPLLARRMHASETIELAFSHVLRSPRPGKRSNWLVTIEAVNGDMRDISCRLLVAADGRNSPIAQELGNEPVSRKENQRSCIFGYFEGVPAPDQNRSLFMLGDRSMAFLYPLGGERALLSAYTPKDEHISGTTQERKDKLIALFESFPDVPDLSRANLVSPLYGYRDYANLVRQPAHRGVAYIGDAAISLDAMSGVGCSFAMTSADMLVESVAPFLRDPEGDLDAGLAAYTGKFDAFFPAHAQGIAADSIIAKSAATTNAVYGRIVRNVDLQRAFIALTGRVLSPAEFQRAYLAAGIAELRRSA